jgi:hypothetical protein
MSAAYASIPRFFHCGSGRTWPRRPGSSTYWYHCAETDENRSSHSKHGKGRHNVGTTRHISSGVTVSDERNDRTIEQEGPSRDLLSSSGYPETRATTLYFAIVSSSCCTSLYWTWTGSPYRTSVPSGKAAMRLTDRDRFHRLVSEQCSCRRPAHLHAPKQQIRCSIAKIGLHSLSQGSIIPDHGSCVIDNFVWTTLSSECLALFHLAGVQRSPSVQSVLPYGMISTKEDLLCIRNSYANFSPTNVKCQKRSGSVFQRGCKAAHILSATEQCTSGHALSGK